MDKGKNVLDQLAQLFFHRKEMNAFPQGYTAGCLLMEPGSKARYPVPKLSSAYSSYNCPWYQGWVCDWVCKTVTKMW